MYRFFSCLLDQNMVVVKLNKRKQIVITKHSPWQVTNCVGPGHFNAVCRCKVDNLEKPQTQPPLPNANQLDSCCKSDHSWMHCPKYFHHEAIAKPASQGRIQRPSRLFKGGKYHNIGRQVPVYPTSSPLPR
jgi:hypothetical protein